MARYLVFAYEAYYPGGGWSDFRRAFNDEQEAVDYADSILPSITGGVEVVDLQLERDLYIYPQHRSAP